MRALLLALGFVLYWLARLAAYLASIGLAGCLLYFCITAVAGALAAGGSQALRAANMLLTMRFGWSQYAPPPVPREPDLGKKEQLQRAAETFHEETGWGGLVN